MKRDRDLDCRKESLLRRKEAQHQEEQALAENRLKTALDWSDIERRRRHIEANWRDGFLERKTLRQNESHLREVELRLQMRDFKERVKISQQNTERSLLKTENDFPGMRKLREQYIEAALRTLEEGNDPYIKELYEVRWWLQRLVRTKRLSHLVLSQPLNIKGKVRGEVMGKVVHFMGIGLLSFCNMYLSFFLLEALFPLEALDHRFWGSDGTKLEVFTALMSCLLSYLEYNCASVWKPWERIKERFMECTKKRCISCIEEKASRVTQVEFKESSKEVCMIRACRIMQKARPAVQEALRHIQANRRKLVMGIHLSKKDLLYSKEAVQSMWKALRPIKKALLTLLPFITSTDDEVALTERWHRSCISEAHRLIDKFWDSKLIPCLFSKGRIEQAQIELIEKVYRFISKKSGLVPAGKELLFRIEEIDEALSEADCLRTIALFPIEKAQHRMDQIDQKHHCLLQQRLIVDDLRKDVPNFALPKKLLEDAEKQLTKMEKSILFQNHPTSLQKRCIETIYLHGLDHGLDCDVQNQIDKLFQDIVMPAEQEMINLHNYVFMGWDSPA